ncbi:hypothetical protein ACHHYP_04581 [Achlya hypogyna]|uniref:RING-type domain-containing protein n=1 Tax=Achlya hypogyna TaxID=1202772 RepID=A0A1V9Z0H4_ACHHY|nr:hypothetical protein ACHHYP_04581 [Achlya hypogyna]
MATPSNTTSIPDAGLQLLTPDQITIVARLHDSSPYSSSYTEYIVSLVCPVHKVWWDITVRHSAVKNLQNELAAHAKALRADPEYVRLLRPVLAVNLTSNIHGSKSARAIRSRMPAYQIFFFTLLHTKLHLRDPHRSAISAVNALVKTVRQFVIMPSISIVPPLQHAPRLPTAPVATMNEVLLDTGVTPSAPVDDTELLTEAPLEPSAPSMDKVEAEQLAPSAAPPTNETHFVLAVPFIEAPNDEATIYNLSCAICLVVFGAMELHKPGTIVKTSCDHLFHAACIGHWIDQATTCPLCRIPIQHITGLQSNDEPEGKRASEGVLTTVADHFGPEAQGSALVS